MKKYIFLLIACFSIFIANAKDYPASLFHISSDGTTLNTRSIQFAIDYIHQQGGGRLVFSVGRYLTGSIHLQSNVTLQLEEGAVLVGSLNPFDYDKKIFMALIFAYDVTNVGLTGKGVIDGQGRTIASNVVALIHSGMIKDDLRNDRPSEYNRPMLINMRGCSQVLIKGVTLRNSACWVQTYDQCNQLTIDSVRVDSRAFWNNDGIDIVDCDTVNITHSYIDAADDGICLKSHDAAKACRHIFISNNTIRSSANAIKFGTASYGGFSDVRIIHNNIFDTYRSAIALEAVDGGFLENVFVDSLDVRNSGNVLFLRIGERVSGKKGRLENITVSHVTAEIAANKPDAGYEYEGPVEDMPRNISPAIIIAGLQGAMINHVIVSHCAIQFPGGGNSLLAKISLDSLDAVPERPAAYPDFSMFKELPAWGIYIRHAKDVEFCDVHLSCAKKDYRTAIVVDDVHEGKLSGTIINEPGNKKKLYQYRSIGIVIQ
jgi:polygalacturonase